MKSIVNLGTGLGKRCTSSKLGLLVNFGAYPKAVVEQWTN